MKNAKTILFCIVIGSVQLAYDIVSAPIMFNVADIKTMAWAHSRYEAMMQYQYDKANPEHLSVAALTEVIEYAPNICGSNKTCEGTMKQMER